MTSSIKGFSPARFVLQGVGPLIGPLCILGRGDQSTVFKWRHEITGKEYAVKQVNRGEDFDKEARLLRILQPMNCPRINNMVFATKASDSRGMIISPFCEHGSLVSYLTKEFRDKDRPVPLKFRWHLFIQLVEAVAFLHYGCGLDPNDHLASVPGHTGIVHRDIYDINVLVTNDYANGSGFPNIVLSDFGWAAKLADTTEEAGQAAMKKDLEQIAAVVALQSQSDGLEEDLAWRKCVYEGTTRSTMLYNYPTAEAGTSPDSPQSEEWGKSREVRWLAHWLWCASNLDSCTALTLLRDMVPIRKMILGRLNGTEV